MGIGFVFIIYLILIGIATVPAILGCAGLGYFLSRRAGPKAKRTFIIVGALLPVAGAGYAVICIILLALAGIASGYDAGFGDGFELPLNNYYHWSAIDTTDRAQVYDTTDRSAVDDSGDTHIETDNRNAFGNVVALQEKGDWLAGEAPPEARDGNEGASASDSWFLFNTRTHERFDAGSEDELRTIAAAHGVELQLQSSGSFYASRRLGGAIVLTFLALLVPPLLVAIFLWRKGRAILAGSPVSNPKPA